MEMVEPFVALVIYPTTKDAQLRHAEKLVKIAAEKVSTLPGFLRSRVLLSEDGESLVTLTEWSDRESFVQFRQSEFGQAAIQLAASLHPQAHWLRQHATKAENDSALVFSEDLDGRQQVDDHDDGGNRGYVETAHFNLQTGVRFPLSRCPKWEFRVSSPCRRRGRRLHGQGGCTALFQNADIIRVLWLHSRR